MTQREFDRRTAPAGCGSRWPPLLVAMLAGRRVPGVAVARPATRWSRYFTSAVGLYPGDDVRVVGVPVGTIDSIEPRATDVKVTMTVHDGVKVPADAKALIIAPNLVSARFVQLTPAYTGGPVLADGAEIGLDRTARAGRMGRGQGAADRSSARSSGRSRDRMQGPLSAFVNQAADTFDGNGDSFRKALRELSQTAGRLGDSRTDLFGTVRNLQVLVNALSNSNEQIVQFSNHVASVSQVLADSSTDLDNTLGTLNQALGDVEGLPQREQRGADRPGRQAGRLHQASSPSTATTSSRSCTSRPTAWRTSTTSTTPRRAPSVACCRCRTSPTRCSSSAAAPSTPARSPDNYKRAEICRQRMGPVFKRITMNYPPMLFHPINSITAYKGQIIYDTPETEAKAQTPVPYLQWQPAPGVTPPIRRPRRHAQRPDAAAARASHAGRSPRPRRRRRRSHADLRPRRCRAPAPPPLPADGGGWLIRAHRCAQGISAACGRSRSRLGRCCCWPAAQFGGLNSLDMPGTAGHGTRLLQDHRRTARRRDAAAELAGDGRRRHRRQRVGHRRRAAARRHVLRGGEAVAGRERQPARRTRPRRSRRPRCWALSTSNSPRRSTDRARASSRTARNIPLDRTGRYPTTEEVLSSLGVVVNKGNLGALQDITDEAYNAVAGRAGQLRRSDARGWPS